MKTLLLNYPEIICEWNYEKNDGLSPNHFAALSNKKVYWTCKTCGGTWYTAISTRTRGSGCPYCSGRKVLKGYNDLQTLRPDIAKDWDCERNDFGPDEVQQFSKKKAFWKCNKGHSYEMAIANRSSQNQGCPYCSGKKVLPGFNDLASRYPELLKDWDYEKNTIKPDEITYGSNKSVYWKCKVCGHEWKASVCSRSSKGQGCINCGNKRGAQKRIKKIIYSGGSLQDKYPELLKDWDYDKNAVQPNEITPASRYKAYWICNKGHSYQMIVSSRTSGKQGCPYCASKKILVGFNDLDYKYPKLSKYWDYEKNKPYTPKNIFPHRIRKYWWLCPKCGTSYKMTPATRIENSEYVLCHKCAAEYRANLGVKKQVDSGNSLASKYPDLAKEWHSTRNGDLTPNDVTPKSGKKVWWECSRCGKEWEQVIKSRTSDNEGCPYCGKAYQTSEPEQIVFYYVRKYFPDAVNSYKDKWLGKKEIDIFIPSRNIGIEYDGRRWHKDIEKDINKGKLLFDNGIKLIRIREDGLPELNDGSYVIKCQDYYKDKKNLESPINELIIYLSNGSINPDINIERDYQEVIDIFDVRREEKSLAKVRPDLINEWHPTKNGKLTPYNVVAGSNHFRIWWKCSVCGYEWETSAAGRATENGTGCPMCARKRVGKAVKERNLIVGKTDFATLYPEIAKEWDYENNNILPTELTAFSGEIVNWICPKGHKYKAMISSRTRPNGTGCPYCSNTKVLAGFNDLATTDPDLASEWDYEKNAPLTPREITRGSSKKVFWICSKCGCHFQATMGHRIRSKREGSVSMGCPDCASQLKAISNSKRYLKIGETDLQTRFPEIAKEWDCAKNGDSPKDYTAFSIKKRWWICDKGHSYEHRISDRTANGYGCPYCSNKRVLPGYNDVATKFPDLIKYWDFDKNVKKPSEFLPFANKKVYWICNKGHSYEQRIASKTSENKGCPYCANKKLLIGFNDLATLFPDVAKDWDYELNDSKPEDHIAGTHDKVHWKCSNCGHRWITGIKNRTYSGTRCPNCRGKAHTIKLLDL